MRVLGWRWVWGVVVCGLMAMCADAQVTFTTLVTFNGANGMGPNAVLTQGADGNFYGTTTYGGTSNTCGVYGCGTIFKITPAGSLTTLYNFCPQAGCTDGMGPGGALVQSANGDFYGTTGGGGKYAGGTVFKITPAGKLTTLYSFCFLYNCADGQYPDAGLVQASNGNFYGTTSGGSGTVFEITPAGFHTTIYYFCSLVDCTDGYNPRSQLVQGKDGIFYGETAEGTGTALGTIFKITARGELTTLLTFDTKTGAYPAGGLTQAANGSFYGVTWEGGNSDDYYCPMYGCGTVFEISPAGNLTTLYKFCSLVNCDDGIVPNGTLVQGTDGNFYGTSESGGIYGEGTIFEITPKGALTTLYNFCTLVGCADGMFPLAGLFQATNGTFYGTTYGSPPGYDGTIFSLSTGLAPFVKTQPTFAKEGGTVGIFGQGFTTSSVVQFGGVAATNVKLSGSAFLFAKVPAGALTGSVTVTTGATTLTSNQIFRVTPQVLSFDPPSGSAGTQVTITGTGFTQTNGVGFGDNVPAEFTVNSDTQVTATVPAGAKTGPVGVVTKGGTGISSATFTVN
jgi:uncharacterized repeat protein (TIGR03803 family)